MGAGLGGGSSSTLSFPMASMEVSGNNGDSLVYTQAPGSCNGGLSSYLSSRGTNRFTSGVPMGGMPTHTGAIPQAVGIPGANMTSHDVLLTPQAIVADGVSTQPLPIPRLGSARLLCGHVSQSLKEKIWKSEYIDISLLIKDSAAAALARSLKASEVALVVQGNKMFLRPNIASVSRQHKLDSWIHGFRHFILLWQFISCNSPFAPLRCLDTLTLSTQQLFNSRALVGGFMMSSLWAELDASTVEYPAGC